MESHETQEPSYYEVALTNRQVLVAFVALLTCLLVAFLSGVWIGRGGREAAIAAAAVATPATVKPGEPPLEQLSFFNGGGSEKAVPKPMPAPVESAPTPAPEPTTAPAASPPEEAAPVVAEAAPAADPSDAMRRNLEETMAANRETPAMRLAVGERTGSAPATAAPTPAPTAAPAPSRPASAAAKPAAVGNIFVQVYSSTNSARAREIVAQLRKAGFAVVMAETARSGGGTNFRVRVGPFAARAEADATAVRLRRDHRLDTWVTDSP